MAFKLVISDPKTGKSYKKEIEDTGLLAGKKIGEVIQGTVLGLSDYELQITGGSDNIGAPIRADVDGAASRRLLITEGVGFRGKVLIKKDAKTWHVRAGKGTRKKKRMRGNTISPEIVQVNFKVTKYGSTPLDKIFPKTEKKEEKPKEEAKKEEPKKQEKPPEKKEEKPKEEKKPEQKKEEKAPAPPKEEKKQEK